MSDDKPVKTVPTRMGNTSIISTVSTVCPQCGLTATVLRDSGRMGCAMCYIAFRGMVVQAVQELHHAATPSRSVAEERLENPWPTRRAEGF